MSPASRSSLNPPRPASWPSRVVYVAGRFNRALLRAAQELAPNRMEIDIIEIGDLPFYNADVEADGDPPVVARFKDRLHAAVGLLIATPEHNDGIPGVLTTAIDWGFAPAGPVASGGEAGGAPRRVPEPGRDRTRPVAPAPAPEPRGCRHAAAARGAGGGRASEVRRRSATDGRAYARCPRGPARAFRALDRAPAGRTCPVRREWLTIDWTLPDSVHGRPVDHEMQTSFR